MQVRTKNLEIDDVKDRCQELNEEVVQLRERLADKADELKVLTSERNKYILDAFDMKWVSNEGLHMHNSDNSRYRHLRKIAFELSKSGMKQ